MMSAARFPARRPRPRVRAAAHGRRGGRKRDRGGVEPAALPLPLLWRMLLHLRRWQPARLRLRLRLRVCVHVRVRVRVRVRLRGPKARMQLAEADAAAAATLRLREDARKTARR